MIRILRAYETPPVDEQSIPSLHVDLEIDNYKWSVGGLDINWDKAQLLSYLESQEADMLRQAKLKPEVETYPKGRNDLLVQAVPPRSMHIAALTAVDTVNKKGTVVRKRMGENYTYDNCYVSLQALEAYQAGKIKLFNNAFGILAPENANSFVLVYFVSENPFDTAIEIPVIVDKLVR